MCGKCPYEVDGVPIPRFKGKARAWHEGWDARKWHDFDVVIAMHKAMLDAMKRLEETEKWYNRVIRGRLDDKEEAG